MSKQNYNELFGEPGASDYRIGDTITFREGDQTFTGEILHISAPGHTPVTRKHTPTTYTVDCGDGFPHLAYQSDIVES